MDNLAFQEFVDNKVSSFKRLEVFAQFQLKYLTDSIKCLAKIEEVNRQFDEVRKRLTD